MAGIVACPSCGTKNRVPTSAAGAPRCRRCHADLPWMVDADAREFDEAVTTRLPVLVDLWAPWCGPCRMIAPGVEAAALELAGRLKVVKVNVDEAPEVSGRFGVQGIPTMLVLRTGEPVGRQVGALPADQVVSWVRQIIDFAR